MSKQCILNEIGDLGLGLYEVEGLNEETKEKDEEDKED